MIHIHPNPSGIRIRIGTYQGPVAEGDPDANLRKIREVFAAEAGNLDFLCFPETFVSGYRTESIARAAISLDDNRIKDLLAETAKQDTVLLFGLSERTADGICNTQAVVYRGGLLGRQRKTMLTPGDSKVFLPDTELRVFDAKGVRFGIAICHTTSFVEPALCLRLMGARLLFTPHFNDIRPSFDMPGVGTFTSAAHRAMVLNNQAALATLLKMVVVRSNVVVIEPEHLGWGDSDIWDMDGIPAARGEPFREMVVRAEFPLEVFTKQNFISRKEVPLALYEKILQAARHYLADDSLV